MVLEKTLESPLDCKDPLDCKEIQPVRPKELSPGCSLEGPDVEAETPIL